MPTRHSIPFVVSRNNAYKPDMSIGQMSSMSMRESTEATEMRTMTAGPEERGRSNGITRALRIEA